MCRLIGLFIGIQLWMIGYVAGRRDEAMHEFTGPVAAIKQPSERTATEAILRAPLGPPREAPADLFRDAVITDIRSRERILN